MMIVNESDLLSQSEGKDGNKTGESKFDQKYYGHGKLLLSGEYFLLDGAKGLALPTTVGQSLSVKHSPSFNPKLHWKSFDVKGECWFESSYEFWQFDCLDEKPSEEALFLQKVLREARKQNKHFLRDEVNVEVETRLGFPIDWGLGSSSTLIYNIAQWAYISPFELLFNTLGGSGYDIACAQSEGPIVYTKNSTGPYWAPINFDPSFKNQIYFLHLKQKEDTQKAISYFKSKSPFDKNVIKELSGFTDQMLAADSLEKFETIISEHEKFVGKHLELTPVKERLFSDYWGEIKSLGAWGGDFVMVTSSKSEKETKQYFKNLGYDVFIPYKQLILDGQTVSFDSGNHNHDLVQ